MLTAQSLVPPHKIRKLKRKIKRAKISTHESPTNLNDLISKNKKPKRRQSFSPTKYKSILAIPQMNFCLGNKEDPWQKWQGFPLGTKTLLFWSRPKKNSHGRMLRTGHPLPKVTMKSRNDTFSSTAESISQPTRCCPGHWAHVIVENTGFLEQTSACSSDCWSVLHSRGQGPPGNRKQTSKGQGS